LKYFAKLMNIPVSVIILTKNEEKDLPGCLESVAWSDDIHVYDSYSLDNTVSIAQDFGANVTRKPTLDSHTFFGGNESEYRNWGLRNIPFKHEWLVQLDADERVTYQLAQEIEHILEANSSCVAYRIRRRDFFLGKWLKNVQVTAYYVRLYRPDSIHYERLVNPVTIVDGSIGQLSGYLDHFPFSKGISHWLNRHNNYSTFEAQQIHENLCNEEKFSFIKSFIAKDFQTRRYHQKELFYRLPARPLIKFFILYFLKKGFLDGKPGLTYAVLQSIYEYMIILKVNEIKSLDKLRDNANSNQKI
jgi:glycosyltransferase involved in cell wall biosynthesis